MKTIKYGLAMLLLLCVLLTVILPVSALTPKETYWLETLRPASLPKPKGAGSYPAELQMTGTGLEPVTLKGTCALEGQLTDEEILNAIKQAAAGTEGYDSPDDAIDDKQLIDELTGELKITAEDRERMLSNWAKLVGIDKVVDLFKGKLPSFGTEDALSTIIGAVMSGKMPGWSALSPVPTDMSGFAIGGIVNGVFISVEEYKRDQEKWEDLVELTNAKARFRNFNGVLKTLLTDKMKERTAWVIRIQQSVEREQTFRMAPQVDAPYTYLSDIVLVKKDGRTDNPVGTYEGSARFRVDVDLSDYDAHFHHYLATYYNDIDRNLPAGIPAALKMEGISQTVHRKSQNRFEIAKDGFSVALTNGLGGVYEFPLNTMKFDLTDYVSVNDMVSVYGGENDVVQYTVTWTEIYDTETGTMYHQDHSVIKNKQTGETTETTNTDDNPMPDTDPRSLLQLRLVVDLSGY